jgi:hypothetical protein
MSGADGRLWPNPEAQEASVNFRLSRYSGPIRRAWLTSALMVREL